MPKQSLILGLSLLLGDTPMSLQVVLLLDQPDQMQLLVLLLKWVVLSFQQAQE